MAHPSIYPPKTILIVNDGQDQIEVGGQTFGRPTDFTPELADTILADIAKGKPISEICAPDNMPARGTVERWMREREDFRVAHSHAREAGADGCVQQAWDVLDAADKNTAPVAREKAAHLRWKAARMAPHAYGDRVQVGGSIDHKHEVVDRRPDWLSKKVGHVAVPLLELQAEEEDNEPDDAW